MKKKTVLDGAEVFKRLSFKFKKRAKTDNREIKK
jgi:hypothetical protein